MRLAGRGIAWHAGLAVGAGLFIFQQYLIRERERKACFRAFLNNNLFGLRVTQGLSSRDGIIPLAGTQDVAGPLARSMIDLVTVLDVTVGEDPADEQTRGAAAHIPDTYQDFLVADALDGARLGLLRDYVQTEGEYAEVSAVIRAATRMMADNGAEVVEIGIDGLEALRTSTSVINYEFREALREYLASSNAPVQSLGEILESGQYHPALEERFRRSQETDSDAEEYSDRLARRGELADLLVAAMATNNLDALVYPTLRVKPNLVGEPQSGSLCHIAAHSGLPAITLPAGFTADGVPVGIELLARPFAEGRLIALGYAWEQVATPRRAPSSTPSLQES